MCGITGFLNITAPNAGVLAKMTDAITHRGPDTDGFWQDGGIAFGHRRLSILDLSPNGAQPMASDNDRYVIAYNGEIYNHLTLRAELPKQNWRGHSDTETILAAIAAWGIETTLGRLHGMFAIALWDKQKKQLTLARDRMGEKPLYIARIGDMLAFGSELKCFLALKDFKRQIDPAALSEYLRYGYVPEPLSIFANVSKLPAGHFAHITHPQDTIDAQAYWSINTVASGAKTTAPFDQVSRHIEQTLSDVIGEQMISDVPLGSFLSGGVDSTLITALMQKTASQPVRSFSIGFSDARFNESEHARAVAAHLGTQHTEFTVTEADALELIPSLPKIYDEPFADSSQIPTTLLARLARRDVTVALSGDGGDEVFGGYNRYLFAPKIWAKIKHIPTPLRRPLGALAGHLHRIGNPEGSRLRALFTKAGLPVSAMDKLGHLGPLVAQAGSLQDIYKTLIATFPNPDLYLKTPQNRAQTLPPLDDALDAVDWMMLQDSLGYLPGDILVKVDRAAMSASLETRAPFLDARVVDAAWTLPKTARIQGSIGKYVLRDILDRHVPRDIIERPKQGFSIPLDRWLRTDLRDWAEELLSPSSINRHALLDPAPVGVLWQAHLSGAENNGQKLWTILMLHLWADKYLAEI